MPLAIRHRHDLVAPPPPLAGLSISREVHAGAMAALQERHEPDMRARIDAGHRAYVASHHGTPAAWGWVATRHAEIGEMGSSFSVPAGARYLWNFVTLPTHRGLGIYPRLLDAIVRAESAEAESFWIAYAPENHASGAGIRKAGFVSVAELSFRADGRPAVNALVHGDEAAASLVGLPNVEETLSPCWRCARSAERGLTTCSAGSCRCDYQRPVSGCAA